MWSTEAISIAIAIAIGYGVAWYLDQRHQQRPGYAPVEPIEKVATIAPAPTKSFAQRCADRYEKLDELYKPSAADLAEMATNVEHWKRVDVASMLYVTTSLRVLAEEKKEREEKEKEKEKEEEEKEESVEESGEEESGEESEYEYEEEEEDDSEEEMRAFEAEKLALEGRTEAYYEKKATSTYMKERRKRFANLWVHAVPSSGTIIMHYSSEYEGFEYHSDSSPMHADLVGSAQLVCLACACRSLYDPAASAFKRIGSLSDYSPSTRKSKVASKSAMTFRDYKGSESVSRRRLC
jgi:hypothetical protein